MEEPETVERPLCKCHGEPMHKGKKVRGEQKWRCSVRAREHNRKQRENKNAWGKAHQDQKRELQRAARKRYKEEGRCTVCGAHLPEGWQYVTCAACRARNAEWMWLNR